MNVRSGSANVGRQGSIGAVPADVPPAGKLSFVPEPPVFSGIADACADMERLARTAQRSLDAEALGVELKRDRA